MTSYLDDSFHSPSDRRFVPAPLVIAAIAILTGCGEGYLSADRPCKRGTCPMEEVPGRPALEAGDGEAWSKDVSDQDLPWLAAGSDGVVRAARGKRLLELEPEPALEPFAPRRSTDATLHAVERYDTHRWLVADDGGIHTATADDTRLSRLGHEFRGSTPRALAVVPNSTGEGAPLVWIADGDGIHRWRSGELETLEFDPGDGWYDLLWGPTVGDGPGAWLLSSTLGVRGIAAPEEDDTFRMRAPDLGIEAVDGAVSSRRTLWVVSADGELYRRSDGNWKAVDVDGRVSAIEGNRHADDVWIQLQNGDVRRFADGAFESFEAIDWGGAHAVHRSGALVASTDDATRWHAPTLDAYLSGVPASNRLQARTTLRVTTSFPNRRQRLRARVDGRSIALDDSNRIALFPSQFEAGSHELVVRAWFRGYDRPATARWSFEARDVSVTWDGQVEPLARKECSACHGPNAATDRRPPLHTRSQWKSRFSQILALVEAGDMPRPADNTLTEGQIARLKAWEEAGFPK